MPEALSSPQLEPLWIVLYVVALFVGSLLAMSLLSGWTALAARFCASARPYGDRFRFASASMGAWFFPVEYSNCLTVTAGGEGIRIAIHFPFRLFHPPLFIPWTMVESVAEKRFLLWRYAKVRIRDHWPRLSIQGRAGRRILELYGGRIEDQPTVAKSRAVRSRRDAVIRH